MALAVAGVAALLTGTAEWVTGRLPARLAEPVAGAGASARLGFCGPDRGLVAVGLGAASWACQMAAVAWTLAAFGLPHSLGPTTAVFLASNLVGAVPVVPGNLGIFSAAVVAALAPFGVAAAPAAAFGLGLQAIEALLSVALGGAFLAAEGVSLAALRRPEPAMRLPTIHAAPVPLQAAA